MKYKLYIVHVGNDGNFTTKFEVCLNGIDNAQDAIRQATKLKDCLKNDYVVQVVRVEEKHVAYATKGYMEGRVIK